MVKREKKLNLNVDRYMENVLYGYGRAFSDEGQEEVIAPVDEHSRHAKHKPLLDRSTTLGFFLYDDR